MKPILTRETDPVISAEPLCNGRFNFGFTKGRLGLKKEDIGAGFPQKLSPSLMEVMKGSVRNAVMAFIFRAISQISAIRPDAS